MQTQETQNFGTVMSLELTNVSLGNVQVPLQKNNSKFSSHHEQQSTAESDKLKNTMVRREIEAANPNPFQSKIRDPRDYGVGGRSGQKANVSPFASRISNAGAYAHASPQRSPKAVDHRPIRGGRSFAIDDLDAAPLNEIQVEQNYQEVDIAPVDNQVIDVAKQAYLQILNQATQPFLRQKTALEVEEETKQVSYK